jgi:hypothetical protein
VWGYSLSNYRHNTLFLFVFWACFATIAFGVLWARIGLFERTGLPVKKRTHEKAPKKHSKKRFWCFGRKRDYELL